MWLAWGSSSGVALLAIHKVIVHKVNEDCKISIDEMGVVLSILLAMEAGALALSAYLANLAARNDRAGPSASVCAGFPSGWCS